MQVFLAQGKESRGAPSADRSIAAAKRNIPCIFRLFVPFFLSDSISFVPVFRKLRPGSKPGLSFFLLFARTRVRAVLRALIKSKGGRIRRDRKTDGRTCNEITPGYSRRGTGNRVLIQSRARPISTSTRAISSEFSSARDRKESSCAHSSLIISIHSCRCARCYSAFKAHTFLSRFRVLFSLFALRLDVPDVWTDRFFFLSFSSSFSRIETLNARREIHARSISYAKVTGYARANW